MPMQIAEPSHPRETTYKTREVEGILDLYFYRRIGFWLAQIFARLKITPAGVSLLGGVCGVLAGHLYFYRSLAINVGGMALHVCANALDNADGQLARLTGAGSRNGRIIDSLADHLVFVSIYFHLAFRCLVEGASPWVCLLAIGAGISHALQGAAADYFRTSYLCFVKKGKRSMALDSSASLRWDYQDLSWFDQPWHKLLLALYVNFTRQQEMLSPHLKRLREMSIRFFPEDIPESFGTQYQRLARPMFKLWGLLMTNTRMLILFILLFIGAPVWYFWIEVTAFNVLLAYLIYRQERMAQSLLERATTSPQGFAIRVRH
jgi:phosphatidylglycerophosphate synthase